MSSKELWVWKHYTKRIVKKKVVGATCQLCKDAKEGVPNTSTMARHLSTYLKTRTYL